MEDFPSNAKKQQQQPSKPTEKEKVIEKVIVGEVVQKKKPFGLKIKEVFMGGEFKSASRYVAADVLLPALRTLIVEVTSKGVERMIYGDTTPNRRPSSGGYPRVSYNTPTDRFKPAQRAYMPGHSSQIMPRRADIADIILMNREDAENVVERLGDLINQYEVASVADLYELVGLPSTYVDNNWGWTSINYVNIRQTRDGFLIDLPRIEPI